MEVLIPRFFNQNSPKFIYQNRACICFFFFKKMCRFNHITLIKKITYLSYFYEKNMLVSDILKSDTKMKTILFLGCLT